MGPEPLHIDFASRFVEPDWVASISSTFVSVANAWLGPCRIHRTASDSGQCPRQTLACLPLLTVPCRGHTPGENPKLVHVLRHRFTQVLRKPDCGMQSLWAIQWSHGLV